MSEDNMKKNLFYTRVFEKCSPKPKDEFEGCCKDEAESILTKVEVFNKIIKETDNRLEDGINNAHRERESK